MTAHDVLVTPMEELGAKVAAARRQQRYGVTKAAAGAHISRDTWNRVEKGLGVHDVKRAAVLDFLGLDQYGEPVANEPEPQEPDGLLDTYSDNELLDELRRRLELAANAGRPRLSAVPAAARTSRRAPGNPAVRQADLDAEAGDPPGPEEGA